MVQIIDNIEKIEHVRVKTRKSFDIDNNSDEQIPILKQNHGNSMGLLRFERKSMAPEATRIPSYPTGPNALQHKEKKQVKEFSVNDRVLEIFK